MIEVKVLVGYAPWQMVSGGIGSRKEGPDGDKWSKTTQETLGGSGVSEANGVLLNPYHHPAVTIYMERRPTKVILTFLSASSAGLVYLKV